MANLPVDDNNNPVPGGCPSVSEANGAASGGLAILAAGATGIKHRIYKIILICDGAKTLTLSDGFGAYYSASGVPIVLDYGSIGKVQNTAATAITVTSNNAANVAALVLYT